MCIRDRLYNEQVVVQYGAAVQQATDGCPGLVVPSANYGRGGNTTLMAITTSRDRYSTKPFAEALSDLLREEARGTDTKPNPVSYTHLDVYKRQVAKSDVPMKLYRWTM